MREIRRRRWRAGSALLTAALTCAEQWGWPVLPGAEAERRPRRGRAGGGGRRLVGGSPVPGPGTAGLPAASRRDLRACRCARPDCPTPGAHPCDPPLLAASTDPRMVRWWWTTRPGAPVVVATGSRVAAVSLPACSGARVLDYFDALRIRVGPVVATPSRHVLLVAPYTHAELGELLVEQEWVPTSLRYHGPGGYVVLPPSRTGTGVLRWEHPPRPDGGTPWLPRIADLVDGLVAAGTATPDGSRLAY